MAENQTTTTHKQQEEEGEKFYRDKEKKVSENDGSSAQEIKQNQESSRLETLPQGLDVKPLASFAPPQTKIEKPGLPHQGVLALACVTDQAQQPMLVQDGYSDSLSELLPVPIKQSLSSTIDPCFLRQRPPSLHRDSIVCKSEFNKEILSYQKMEVADILPKSPAPDGYNWRKYGQKAVKSNDSSRSYYRCTYNNCHAKKKVERCDSSGDIIEIIYKGQHNHDPPQKIRCTKARVSLSNVGTISSPDIGEGCGTLDSLTREFNSSSPSTPRKKLRYAKLEQDMHSSTDKSLNAALVAKSEENCDQIDANGSTKGGSTGNADSTSRTIKEPKIIVQASGDVGTSGDGYRWRKYGQKMVKGNSNPRSYYKCTSPGCPVRKHVEKATDDTKTTLITYEGKHDHDMPVARKHQDPPSTHLTVAASADTNNADLKTPETSANPIKPKQWSMDVEGEEAKEKSSECGGEKALDSARTLLSIGIEIMPC